MSNSAYDRTVFCPTQFGTCENRYFGDLLLCGT